MTQFLALILAIALYVSPGVYATYVTHEELATGGTPLGMGLPTLGTERLPVQARRGFYRPLPKCRAADRS